MYVDIYRRCIRDSLVQLCVVWDMTHSYLRHDSLICMTWRINRRETLIIFQRCIRSAFIWGTWLIYTWDMTHLYVGHDSFTGEGHTSYADGVSVTFLDNSKWDISHHDSIIYYIFESCLIFECAYTYIFRHIASWLNNTLHILYERVTSHIWMRIYIYIETYCIHTWDMTQLYILVHPHPPSSPLPCDIDTHHRTHLLHDLDVIQENHRSLLQKSLIKETVFCKRDLWF